MKGNDPSGRCLPCRRILRSAAIGCLLGLVASCWGRFDPLHPYDFVLPETVVTWEKYLGQGEGCGRSVRQTADGGYIVLGDTDHGVGGPFDLCLVKTDAAGNELWSRTFGGIEDDCGNCVVPTADGGYLLTGSTRSYGAGEEDLYLVKTDSSGIEQWSRTFGGAGSDEGWCVQCTADGGCIVTGFTSPGAGVSDVYLLKTDSSGVEEWSRAYGLAYEERGYCVRQTSDGGYVIAGLAERLAFGEDDAWMVKTDSDGVLQWSRVFGGAELDGGTSVLQIADGGYVLAGYTHSAGAGDFDAWMIRTDSAGDELWSKTYGGGAWDRADAIEATGDGGYIIAGMTKSIRDRKQAWLIKTDEAGTEQWSRDFGSEGDEWVRSVRQTADGGYILAGEANALMYLIYFKP